MRERTTWIREDIVKKASVKVAEDPRAMNQDHLKQQPAADKYVMGTPSDFAEDVHPSAGTWKAEYSGDEVKRNEIGMPEMRADTFKAAAVDEEALVKKASLAVRVARRILPKKASEGTIETQAVAFMSLSDADLIATHNRLAADQDDDEEETQQKQAQDQGDKPWEKDEDEKSQKQAQQQQADKDEEEKSQKQAGQMPPQFRENAEKKKEEAAEKKEDEEKSQKQAGQMPPQFRENAEKKKEEAAEKKEDEEKSQKQAQQQAQQDEAQEKQAGHQMFSQEQLQQMVQAMVQSALQQMQGGQQQQPAMQQQAQCGDDDQILDQMLQDDLGQDEQNELFTAGDDDIQLEGSSMDVSDTKLSAEDDVLTSLFASHPDVIDAAHAQALQHGSVTSNTRTASVKVLGTKPANGVSKLGGTTSKTASSDADKLTSLWATSPDVSDVFR